jgi:hypothetical protein
VRAGDFLYIPANLPHLPYNLSQSESCVVVIARTDPNEQESVVLLPELDAVHEPHSGTKLFACPPPPESPRRPCPRSKMIKPERTAAASTPTDTWRRRPSLQRARHGRTVAWRRKS